MVESKKVSLNNERAGGKEKTTPRLRIPIMTMKTGLRAAVNSELLYVIVCG